MIQWDTCRGCQGILNEGFDGSCFMDILMHDTGGFSAL